MSSNTQPAGSHQDSDSSSYDTRLQRSNTDSIIVTNIDNVTPELLRLYFERPKSGGGDIAKIKITAVIEFKNKNVVASVLQRDHTLDGKSLQVNPYIAGISNQGGISSADRNKFVQIALQEARKMDIPENNWNDFIMRAASNVKRAIGRSTDLQLANDYDTREKELCLFATIRYLTEEPDFQYSIVVEILLRMGVDPLVLNENGATMLDFLLNIWHDFPETPTCTIEKYRILKLLLQKGGSYFVKDSSMKRLGEIIDVCHMFSEDTGECLPNIETSRHKGKYSLLMFRPSQAQIQAILRILPRISLKCLICCNISMAILCNILKHATTLHELILIQIEDFDVRTINRSLSQSLSSLSIIGVPLPLRLECQNEMKVLNISHCRSSSTALSKSQPSLILKIKGVKQLYLHNNGLECLPDRLHKIEGLEHIVAHDNEIETLPIEVSKARHLRCILIHNNPIDNIPHSLLRLDTYELMAYMKELANSVKTENKLNLVLLGDKKSGKTVLRSIFGDREIDTGKWQHMEFKVREEAYKKTMKQIPRTHGSAFFRCLDLTDIRMLDVWAQGVGNASVFVLVVDLHGLTVTNVYKEDADTHQLGRIHYILQMIHTLKPNARVAMVGVYTDEQREKTRQDGRRKLYNMIASVSKSHRSVCRLFEGCLVHTPSRMMSLDEKDDKMRSFKEDDPYIAFPHIIGYHEISKSAFSQCAVTELKQCIHRESARLLAVQSTIPETWVNFRKEIAQHFSPPLSPLTMNYLEYTEKASALGIENKDECQALSHALQYLVSQGDILLSTQQGLQKDKKNAMFHPGRIFRITQRCIEGRELVNQNGQIETDKLSQILPDSCADVCSDFIQLLGTVGKCFSPKLENTELSTLCFPSKLPMGELHDNPLDSYNNPDQRQLNRCIGLSFIPTALFGHIISEVSKRKDIFAAQPVYFRNHIVYTAHRVTRACSMCRRTYHCNPHQIHVELNYDRGSIEITVRGSHPRCFMFDIVTLICDVLKSAQYRGIHISHSIICPRCLSEGDAHPFQIPIELNNLVCQQHTTHMYTKDELLNGYHAHLKAQVQTKSLVRHLPDTECPKLFVLLPVTVSSTGRRSFPVNSCLNHGFAVHFVCECRAKWHITDTPGYCVERVREFVSVHGERSAIVLKALATMFCSFEAAKQIEPHPTIFHETKMGHFDEASNEFAKFYNAFVEEFPTCQSNATSLNDPEDLIDEVTKESRVVSRNILTSFLDKADDDYTFAGLFPVKVEGSWAWMCRNHAIAAISDLPPNYLQ